MVNSNADALGIIFPNSYDRLVPDLVSERRMASIPFAGRYRMVDFILSGMANCGIGNIAVIVRNNYYSLMDHLGYGREWDLARKNGGLDIIPPYAENNMKLYNGRVEALANILPYLKKHKEKYVIMADTNIAVNFDFQAMLKEHMESGADVTIAYKREPIPEILRNMEGVKDLFYTLSLEDGRVKKIYINSQKEGDVNFGMNIYVMKREFLINEINTAFVRGYTYFERDILAPQLCKFNVRGYEYKGYMARICDMRSYFEENMKLLEEKNLDALFAGGPVHTKIRDDNPTRYIKGAKAKNVLVADGCVIEGEVENSILFRGVKIAKGAKVKNCVLMQDTVVKEGARLEYVITDKNAVINVGKELYGTDSFQVFVPKNQNI